MSYILAITCACQSTWRLSWRSTATPPCHWLNWKMRGGTRGIPSAIGREARGSRKFRRHVLSFWVGWEDSEVSAVSVKDCGVWSKATDRGKNDLNFNLTSKCFFYSQQSHNVCSAVCSSVASPASFHALFPGCSNVCSNGWSVKFCFNGYCFQFLCYLNALVI